MFEHKIQGRSVPILLLVFLLALPGCENSKEETVVGTTVRNEKVAPPVSRPAEEVVATQDAFIEVYSGVMPAVVNISATRMRSPENLGPLFEHFFGDLFKQHPRPQREAKSLGSGFIISREGFILTNEHVTKDAEEIEVTLADGRTFAATVTGSDPRTDVAVIKIETEEDLPVVVLGDSDELNVGQWALAIGNPFGLEGTLTVGVISATQRANLGIEDYEDFIQTDASINPGNSGGPLLNIHGEVVGINTAIVAAGQGIGFAIPINLARLIADQLIETGEVTRGWLGVSIQPLTRELAESFGLDRTTGALVTKVLPGTPAEKAGLQRGDVLLELNGKEIRGVRELQLLVASAKVGETVELVVLRQGERLTLAVTLVERDENTVAATPEKQTDKPKSFGIRIGPNDEGAGVRVIEVESGSVAARAGVRPGDVILSVNRVEVADVAAFQKETAKIETGDHVVLLLQRGETTRYLAFKVL